MTASSDTLLLCWGNPGRKDDGLGPALARLVEERSLPGVTVEAGYQLQVEDADQIARHRRVLFVDADRTGPEPFSLQRLEPAVTGLSFSSHSVAPAALLTLTRELFYAEPEAWLLGIRGHEFDAFDESLSAPARANLAAALDFVTSAVEAGRFEETPPTDRETA